MNPRPSSRWALHAAAAGLALVAACGVAAGIFGVLAGRVPAYQVIPSLPPLAFAGCGWLLAVRKPRNAVGWLLLVSAIAMDGVFSASAYASWSLRQPGTGPLASFSTWVSGWAFIPLLTCLAMLLPLLFPDGHLPSRRWRILLGVDLLCAVLTAGNVFLDQGIDVPRVGSVPNPYAITAGHTVFNAMIAAAAPLLVLGLSGSVAAVVSRFRRAQGDERQQMKYVVCALLLAPLPFVTYQWSVAVSSILFIVALPLVPVAIGVAILRYRLYDIDRIVSRTVSYALVTGLLFGVYVGCVALFTRVLPFNGDVGTAASVLVAVALFAPLRRRVQHRVDRRFNRARYDAEATVAAFAGRLQDQVDLDAVRADLLGVVQSTVAPEHASLWLRQATP